MKRHHVRGSILVATVLTISCAGTYDEPAASESALSAEAPAEQDPAEPSPDGAGDCYVRVTCQDGSTVRSCNGTAGRCSASTTAVTCNGVSYACPASNPCGTDGFCNSSCIFDNDCICPIGQFCVDDGDCSQGYCHSFGVCYCG